jgi:hypothetical protein
LRTGCFLNPAMRQWHLKLLRIESRTFSNITTFPQ